MPAPCPGDPDYPQDEMPLTRENFEAEIARIRGRRAPIVRKLREAEADPATWDDAARTELHGFDGE